MGSVANAARHTTGAALRALRDPLTDGEGVVGQGRETGSFYAPL
ncbi:MAG TPA: hypothetical protein VGF15_07035 [Solirubrobacteraceae bacterium]